MVLKRAKCIPKKRAQVPSFATTTINFVEYYQASLIILTITNNLVQFSHYQWYSVIEFLKKIIEKGLFLRKLNKEE